MAFVGATDLERAKRFYRDVLGMDFRVDEGFAAVFDSGGTMLRISKVEAVAEARYTVLGWEVKDIGETVRVLLKRGVIFERYPQFGVQQDELGIWTAPDKTKVAWFKDPDGNILSVTEFSSH